MTIREKPESEYWMVGIVLNKKAHCRQSWAHKLLYHKITQSLLDRKKLKFKLNVLVLGEKMKCSLYFFSALHWPVLPPIDMAYGLHIALNLDGARREAVWVFVRLHLFGRSVGKWLQNMTKNDSL